MTILSKTKQNLVKNDIVLQISLMPDLKESKWILRSASALKLCEVARGETSGDPHCCENESKKANESCSMEIVQTSWIPPKGVHTAFESRDGTHG